MSDAAILAICIAAIVVSCFAFMAVGVAVTHRWPWDGDDAWDEEDDNVD